MSQFLLTVNTGSSSIKLALFECPAPSRPEKPLLTLKARDIGSDAAEVVVRIAGQKPGAGDRPRGFDLSSFDKALGSLSRWLADERVLADVAAVSHRVVCAGAQNAEAVEITDAVLDALRRYGAVDPDHLPQTLAAIGAFRASLPEAVPIACFDSAFHSHLPALARRFAMPRAFHDAGVRRFGYHGLAYASVLDTLAGLHGERIAGRLVLAHLGSGASMAAVAAGRSVDTTMGFSPASGLVMSTRAGDIEAAALLYYMQDQKVSVDEAVALINREAGLKGLSGGNGDMEALLRVAHEDAEARFAVDVFCYHARQTLGAYIATLGGLDLLAFSGGIGENSPEIRACICTGLESLGVSVDERANLSNIGVISSPESKALVRIVPSDEERMLARYAEALLARR